ncbi:MAG: molybdopterin molybdotransferase MoeA [Anaerolineae bacterium]
MPESPYPMIPVEQALSLILQEIHPLPPVQVSFDEALGLVLAEDVHATEPLPPFRAASVDGYAVIASDTTPVRKIVGDQSAGYLSQVSVAPGTAVRVTTGAPVPQGADAVVMVEFTETREGSVHINSDVRPGDNIRPIGQDIAEGQLVLSRGTALGPPEIGLLAMIGKTQVLAHPAPRVGVMSTGDELVEPHQPPGPGQIRDANRFSLMSAVREAGGVPIDLGKVTDEPGVLQATLERGLRLADALLTSGGVSMGQLDLVKPYLARHGKIHFGRVRAKPGKPVTFATLEGVPVFAMPGFPVSALVSFEIYVRPALRKMAGHTHLHRPRRRVTLTHAVTHAAGRTEFQRAIVTRHSDGRHTATTTGFQGSGRLLSMHGANALLILPYQQGDLPAGAEVEAIITGPLQEANGDPFDRGL